MTSSIGSHFVISGRKLGSGLSDTDRGYYWSKTPYDVNEGYDFAITLSGSVWPTDKRTKQVGHTEIGRAHV